MAIVGNTRQKRWVFYFLILNINSMKNKTNVYIIIGFIIYSFIEIYINIKYLNIQYTQEQKKNIITHYQYLLISIAICFIIYYLVKYIINNKNK